MSSTLNNLVFGLCLLINTFAYTQTNQEIAFNKALEAIELMDNGKFEESLKLLEEAEKLDPERFDFPYEKAYAYYSMEDYKNAIEILENIKNHKDVTERLFQLLGNSYDLIEKSEKAFEIYEAGLVKFPNSGALYLEKGNVYWGQKEFNKALDLYEKGIYVDPTFPSNYYRAANLYLSSTEEVWGLIYGEIFMNLERNSKRTAEMSKQLFDTYKSEIKFKSKSEMEVSFCQNMQINVSEDKNTKEFKMPFCMIYEPTLLIPIAFEKKIDINSLDRIRTGFVDNYFKSEREKTHPNILFSYQKKLKEAGHLEAYNHWILMKGDESNFEDWYAKNKGKWDAFVIWFKENPLKLDDSNRFYKDQYN